MNLFVEIGFVLAATVGAYGQESMPTPQEKAPEKKEAPAAPRESDPAALAYLKTVDDIMYNYPDAGVHTLTFKMKLGNNPMMSPEQAEALKDLALIYHWREEPWGEATDVVGLPAEAASQKANMAKQGLSSMRHMVPHSMRQLATHYIVTMSKDGEATKLQFKAKPGEKTFQDFTTWHDKSGKLTKSQDAGQPEVAITLMPFGTKYVISEGRPTGMAEVVMKFEYGKSGEVCVMNKMSQSSGPMSMDFPIEVTLNPKHEPSTFGGEEPKKEEKPH